MRNEIFAEFQKGTPFFAVPDAVELPKYEDWAGYDAWLSMNAWRFLMEIAIGWVSSLPDVEMQNSIASLPGTTGVWLRKGMAIDQPQVILAGREFTHIHPDGSLHAPLPFARAMKAVEMGWAERHPWAEQRADWEGLVMLYTPQSEADLEIVFQLIVESYNFVTGQHEVTANYIRS